MPREGRATKSKGRSSGIGFFALYRRGGMNVSQTSMRTKSRGALTGPHSESATSSLIADLNPAPDRSRSHPQSPHSPCSSSHPTTTTSTNHSCFRAPSEVVRVCPDSRSSPSTTCRPAVERRAVQTDPSWASRPSAFDRPALEAPVHSSSEREREGNTSSGRAWGAGRGEASVVGKCTSG